MSKEVVQKTDDRIKIRGKRYLSEHVVHVIKKIYNGKFDKQTGFVKFGSVVTRFHKHILPNGRTIYLIREDGDGYYYYCSPNMKLYKMFNLFEYFQKEEERDKLLMKKLEDIEKAEMKILDIL